MCFDEKTSWTTFIIGTIGNIWLLSKGVNDKIRIGLFVLWQSVLFVQFLEAMLWRSINEAEKDAVNVNGTIILYNKYEKCKSISRVLLALLVGQPIIFILASTYTSDKLVTGSVIAMLYGLFAIYGATYTKVECPLPTEKCPHLTHNWLGQIPYGGFAYMAVSVLAIAFFNQKVVVPLAGFLAVTYGLSKMIYSCASSSLWCWFAALAPYFTMVVY
jgi:hypothetical protein